MSEVQRSRMIRAYSDAALKGLWAGFIIAVYFHVEMIELPDGILVVFDEDRR